MFKSDMIPLPTVIGSYMWRLEAPRMGRVRGNSAQTPHCDDSPLQSWGFCTSGVGRTPGDTKGLSCGRAEQKQPRLADTGQRSRTRSGYRHERVKHVGSVSGTIRRPGRGTEPQVTGHRGSSGAGECYSLKLEKAERAAEGTA